MASLVERSLIRFGNGGLVVSIPIAWARYYNLLPGDKVVIIANSKLTIRPKKEIKLKSG